MTSLLSSSPLAWAAEKVGFKPYPYQSKLLVDRAQRLLILKARQIGISHAAAILAAHHVIHTDKAVALVVSRDQGAASDFVRQVYEIMDRLDEPLTFVRRGVLECELANGSRIVSQPATATAGRGLTATMVVLDEFAFAANDAAILRAVLPTLSRGGRLIVISTPDGIGNVFFKLWSGEDAGTWSRHRIPWQLCPVFTPDWYEANRPNFTAQAWASEFECDFTVSGNAVFNADDIAELAFGWLGEQPAQPEREYISGWDIGRHHDPTVGITIDITAAPYQVVRFERLLNAPYATTQERIKQRATDYPGRTVVEANSIGDPIIEALSGISVQRFNTTATSKAAAVAKLQRLVENHALKCGQEQLLNELRGYQYADQKLIQDSVVALMIACWPILEVRGEIERPVVATTTSRAAGLRPAISEQGAPATLATASRVGGMPGRSEYRSRGRQNNGRMADVVVSDWSKRT